MMEEAGKPRQSKKISGPLILVVPKKLGQMMKKGPGSEMTPPDSFSSQPDLRKSDSPSSLSRFSFKKVQSWNLEIPFMGPCTGKAYLKDPSFLKFSPKSNELSMDATTEEAESVENGWHDGDDDQRVTDEKEGGKRADALDSISASTDLNTTVIHCQAEEMSEDEFSEHPIICDSRVQVMDDYYVKRSLSSTMRSILNDHGDIARNCKLSSVVMRSYYLECLCFVVRELRSSSPVNKASKAKKMKEIMTITNDVEAAGIEVGWLREVIDEIKAGIELSKKRKPMEDERKKLEGNEKGIADSMGGMDGAQE
ncbi:hypothetical protein SAY86_014390 [Trapa natans]|uniref:Uncharacterized protein n=1 Tax=Trapa natans TaxID=22666 RepID=A0AAN7KZ34_TRANT|nr:hypothetical protein SAY86_014390 [Trapa natans]